MWKTYFNMYYVHKKCVYRTEQAFDQLILSSNRWYRLTKSVFNVRHPTEKFFMIPRVWWQLYDLTLPSKSGGHCGMWRVRRTPRVAQARDGVATLPSWISWWIVVVCEMETIQKGVYFRQLVPIRLGSAAKRPSDSRWHVKAAAVPHPRTRRYKITPLSS